MDWTVASLHRRSDDRLQALRTSREFAHYFIPRATLACMYSGPSPNFQNLGVLHALTSRQLVRDETAETDPHTHTHTLTLTHTHSHTHACMHACKHARMHVSTHARAHKDRCSTNLAGSPVQDSKTFDVGNERERPSEIVWLAGKRVVLRGTLQVGPGNGFLQSSANPATLSELPNTGTSSKRESAEISEKLPATSALCHDECAFQTCSRYTCCLEW